MRIQFQSVCDETSPECAELYSHQRATVEFAKTHKRFADLSDMGTGKTRSQLDYISLRLEENENFLTLVIAPKTIIQDAWIGDIKKFYPWIKAVAAIGSHAKKVKAFETKASVYVTNYETMLGRFDFTDSGFDLLICDEAVQLKNPRAQRTKAITELARFIPEVHMLSGLITPNNLLEIFAPFNIICRGVLGKNFWQFRDRYFTPDPWSYENRSWIPKKNSENEITKRLAPYIIRHSKDECLDLPEKVYTVRKVDMAPEQRRVYKEMEREAIARLKDVSIQAVSKGVIIQKLAQISSGFIYDSDKQSHHFYSGKLKELNALLHGELIDEQVIIFTNYREETKYFREKYAGESFIYGGQGQESQKKDIDNFKSGKNRLLFANISSAKYGLTFTNCHYVIYFSMNYSLDDAMQSQDRIHRIGQKHKAQYIYLLSEGTVDENIYDAIQGKKELNDLIISLIESY